MSLESFVIFIWASNINMKKKKGPDALSKL